jgi:kinetochore protein Nuf2
LASAIRDGWDVSEVFGHCRDELQQPVFAAIDAIEFPELHDESIPAMAFFIKAGALLRASGVKDFSLKDVHKPDAQRLKRNLSAIINFAKFREEKLIAYTELQEKHAELVNTRDSLKAEHERLHAELKQLQEELDSELPEVSRVEADIDMLYGENQSLNKQHGVLSNEVRSLKQQAGSLADTSSELRMKLSSAMSAQEDLKSQIVHSPHKIKSMLEDVVAALEREKAALAESEKRARDVASRLDGASKLEKEVAKTLSLMQDAEGEVQKKKEVSKKVKALKSEVAAHEHEVTQLEATKQHLDRQHVSLLERLERLKAQCDVKKQAAEGRVEEQMRHKEAIEAGNAAALAKLNENEGTIRAIEDKAAEIRAAHEAQIGSVLGQYHALREAVAQYQEVMEASMSRADENKDNVTDYSITTQSLLDVR